MAIFASDDLVPATRVQINFGVGPSTVGAGTRRILLTGPKLATGEAVVNTVYRVTSEADAELYFGAGSPLHIAVRGVLSAWKKAPLYCLAHLPTSSGGVAAAEAVLHISGTASKSGSIALTVGGVSTTVGYALGATAISISDNVEAAVQAITHLPATCAATDAGGDGYATFTAKTAGTSQNDVIRVRAVPTPGTGITCVLDSETLDGGAEGSTTELSLLTTALDVVENERYYYMGLTNSSAAAIALLKTHIQTKSEPDPGLRSVGIVAYTLSDVDDDETLALASNYERLDIISQPYSEVHNAYLCGHWVGIRAKRELENRRYNFANYAQADWNIPRVYSSSNVLSSSKLQSAIANGVTVVQSGDYGSYVVRSVSTASKNSTGTINDFRKLDTHIVSVADEVADVVVNRHANIFVNFALAEDQLLDDGITVNPLQRVPPRTLTPSRYSQWLQTELSEFNSTGQITKYTDTVESISAAVDSAVKSRLNVEFDLYVIPLLMQTGLVINESSSG